MDRESLQLLALILFAIAGFFLFVLLLALLELDQLLPTTQSKPASKSSENSAPMAPPTYSTNPFASLRALPFRLLQDATANFSHSNLLHAGLSAQTFVGSLHDVQEEEPAVVAVKRFQPSSITPPSAPADDHYTAELHIHSNATYLMQSYFVLHGHDRPHPQFIAPLLGYCVEGQERLLVYKYAPHRDLSTVLALSSFGWNNITCMPYAEDLLLPWITRLKIAIRVAEALAFLHHTCQPGIAHRDVKASGILLIEDFDVWLGSLTEARTLEEGELPLYDIYCFGKLLLHLISGLNIITVHIGDDNEDSSATHHPPWMLETLPLINYQMKLDSFLKLVDPSMGLDDENLVREVLGVAILAKACLDSTMLENLSMLTILHFLQNPLDLLKEPF